MIATSQAANTEWAIRLLAYVSGVLSTIGGSWITSKIHTYYESRKAHLEDIKQKVFVPIRSGLEDFRPLLFHQSPIVSVERGPKKYHEAAQITEVPIEEGLILSASFPGASVFGQAESAASGRR